MQGRSDRQGTGSTYANGTGRYLYGIGFAPQGEHQSTPAATVHHDSGSRRRATCPHRSRKSTYHERGERKGNPVCGRCGRGTCEESEVRLQETGPEIRQANESRSRRRCRNAAGSHRRTGKERFLYTELGRCGSRNRNIRCRNLQ